ncbi:MAG: phosphoribosylanthranilate isomerase [Phycisphaeraceae bacterium]|nr:MAG: phosphoribosylanthranilate isomerase [Phycisphaeraceae bacterium]
MSRVRTRVKICGIRDRAAALAAAEAGADAVGFVFVGGSKRSIEPEDAAEIMYALPPMVTSVGVVRDLSVDEFCDLEQRCPCELMQMHGSESEKTVATCGPGIIRGIRFDPATIASELKRWSRMAEVGAILVDGSAGGEGESFEWARLGDAVGEMVVPKPIIVAGGLHADNVADAIRAVRPWAVDVSSGVESEPGVKDHGAIRAFCEAVHTADAALRTA